MLDRARERLDGALAARARPTSSTCRSPPRSFQTVGCFAMLHVLDDPWAALAFPRRVPHAGRAALRLDAGHRLRVRWASVYAAAAAPHSASSARRAGSAELAQTARELFGAGARGHAQRLDGLAAGDGARGALAAVAVGDRHAPVAAERLRGDADAGRVLAALVLGEVDEAQDAVDVLGGQAALDELVAPRSSST